MADYSTLRSSDLLHLWHPYTRIDKLEKRNFPIIDRASGVWLYTVDGHKLMDGISSWWCVNLGHSHPRIVEAIRKQANTLQHSILGGMSHARVIELAEQLTSLAPAGLTRAYFASDGASATEAAMRLAVQYWYNLGYPEKNRLVSLRDGYHGDTLGAVGVGYIDAYHSHLSHIVNRAIQADSPHCFACPAIDACDMRCFASMKRMVEDGADQIAAVIVEPLCQGAAGMRIYPAAYLRELRRLCDRNNVLLIADEIAVGFGRTGCMFACEYADIVPDLMCVGKGLTGGALPMSGVLCGESIREAFRDDADRSRTFFHGHTYCGNPIAAAAALAALAVYVEEDIAGGSFAIAQMLADSFAELATLSGVTRTRTLGTMSALQVDGGIECAGRVADLALDKGLLIRPLGDILYLWPPLTTSVDEMADMLELFATALRAGI